MNGEQTAPRPPAETIRELDLHLRYVQEEVGRVASAMANMATKEDIAAISAKMDAYATKVELKALEDRLVRDSAKSTFQRILSSTITIGAAAAVLAAFAGAVVKIVLWANALPH